MDSHRLIHPKDQIKKRGCPLGASNVPLRARSLISECGFQIHFFLNPIFSIPKSEIHILCSKVFIENPE